MLVTHDHHHPPPHFGLTLTDGDNEAASGTNSYKPAGILRKRHFTGIIVQLVFAVSSILCIWISGWRRVLPGRQANVRIPAGPFAATPRAIEFEGHIESLRCRVAWFQQDLAALSGRWLWGGFRGPSFGWRHCVRNKYETREIQNLFRYVFFLKTLFDSSKVNLYLVIF